MGFLLKQTLSTMIDTKNKLGSISKAKIQDLRSRPYDPPVYFRSKNHQLIYVVNPKCGCSSIKNAIMVDNGIKLNTEHYDNIHAVGRDYNFEVSNPTPYLNHHFFSFVRNPFDRIRSLYINKFLDYTKISQSKFEYKIYLGGILKQDDDFASFIKKISIIPRRLADRHFKSQTQLLYHESPKLDFIGKLETFESDMSVLENKFNFNYIHQIHNKSSQNDHNLLYNKESYEIVRELFRDDIQTFGYEKEADKLYFKLKS